MELGSPEVERPGCQLLLRGHRGLQRRQGLRAHRPQGRGRRRVHRHAEVGAVRLPAALGYSAFFPLPSAFFDDTKAFGENPIGNGPYKLDGKKAWNHNESIKLVANQDYKGGRKPKNGGLTITFYASQDTAYADAQGGNLDVLDAVPDSAFKTYKSDFATVRQPGRRDLPGVHLPYYLDHLKGEEGKLRREAISMAINRKEITDKIFDGTRTPAKDFTSPVIAGWNDDLEGSDVLDYNESEAKKLGPRPTPSRSGTAR